MLTKSTITRIYLGMIECLNSQNSSGNQKEQLENGLNFVFLVLSRDLLNKYSIKFIPQHKFDDCKNKNVLPFDFYLPDYNTCIEFNGIQHYKAIEYFGGEKRFKEQNKTDLIKKEYCKNKKIKLIIIKYNEKIDKITKILKIKMDE